jgi:hypothetical protein
MWSIATTTRWEHDQKWYAKKRPNELAAALRNLERYLAFLSKVPNSKVLQAGFIHPEPADVVAIDQSAGGGNLEETRLYVYPDDSEKIVYLITIGNKAEQSADIQCSKGFVETHRKTKEA